MLDLLSCLGCRHHPVCLCAVCLCAAGHAVSVNAVLLIAVGRETWLSCCTTICVSCGVVSCNHALTQLLTHPPTHARNWSLAHALTHLLTHVVYCHRHLQCACMPRGRLVCMLGSSRPPVYTGPRVQDSVWDQLSGFCLGLSLTFVK